MKRHIVTILFTALILLLISGCGAGDEAVDGTPDAEENYVFVVKNNAGEPVEGVGIQVCTKEKCQVIETDEEGMAVFEGGPNEYEIHLIKYPDEYYYDKSATYVTKREPEKVEFVLEDAKEIAEIDDEEADDTATSEVEPEPVSDAADDDGFPFVEKLCDVKPSEDKVVFNAVDINGNAIDDSIFADYDLTLVNLWEHWCPPCLDEMQYFEEAYEMAKEYGIKFNVIGFYGDNDEEALAKLEELGITYTIAKDNGDLKKEYWEGYVPVNIFVNKDGYILPGTDEEVRAYLIEGYRQLYDEYISGVYDDYEFTEDDLEFLNELEEACTGDEEDMNAYVEDVVADYTYSRGQFGAMPEQELYQAISNRMR